MLGTVLSYERHIFKYKGTFLMLESISEVHLENLSVTKGWVNTEQ